jgi:hypothetical protein
MAKRVYLFSEGSKDDRDLLGGKGANLCEMTRLGLPVPFGFVITTPTCREYFDTGNRLPLLLEQEYRVALDLVEKKMGARFGDPENPLLFSVRSGAPVSMPGMMNTILNLGINDDIAAGLAQRTGNPRFAYDCYRRFIQMFADVVLDADAMPWRGDRGLQAANTATPTTWPCRRRTGRRSSSVSRPWWTSPRIPSCSCVSPSRRCSSPGTPTGQCLPRDEQHPRFPGHGGQRAVHGVRQLR